ncbi:MAG: N-acetylmuramoyl-L-alanine amidase, partial [Rhizobiales bacterium]|nr:N-acetylmuramoyl-L-alanine amidase [Hyphomicrobiales bacterium]
MLNEVLIEAVCQIAMTSPIASYEWADRGVAPSGYTQGMAVAFAIVLQKYLDGDSSALDMAQADSGDPEVDALTWYADLFAAEEMDNSRDGLDTLRHVFVLLMGLGMRESSGQHCCGRDMSADNVDADTAEAGLFQMSWNMKTCSDEMPKLLAEYETLPPQCALHIFAQGVTCASSDWASYGSGEGYLYQDTAKRCPTFAVETAAIGLRHR